MTLKPAYSQIEEKNKPDSRLNQVEKDLEYTRQRLKETMDDKFKSERELSERVKLQKKLEAGKRNLEIEIKHLQMQLVAAEEQTIKAESSYESSQNIIKYQEDKILNFEEEVSALKAEIHNLKHERDSVKEELKEAFNEINKLKESQEARNHNQESPNEAIKKLSNLILSREKPRSRTATPTPGDCSKIPEQREEKLQAVIKDLKQTHLATLEDFKAHTQLLDQVIKGKCNTEYNDLGIPVKIEELNRMISDVKVDLSESFCSPAKEQALFKKVKYLSESLEKEKAQNKQLREKLENAYQRIDLNEARYEIESGTNWITFMQCQAAAIESLL